MPDPKMARPVNDRDAIPPRMPAPRKTSIEAHTLLVVATSMSTAEMDLLCNVLTKADSYSLNAAERDVVADFLAAVEGVR